MSAFLVYILKVALLTAVFVLLYHLLLRRETFHRTARIVLVSSLIISYILPFCVITIHRPAPVVENPEVAAIQAPAAVPSTPTRHTVQPDIQPGERQIRQEQNQIEEQVRIQALPQQEVRQAVVFPDSNQSLPVPTRKHMDWILVSIIIYALGVVCLIILRLLSAVKVIGIIHRGRTIVKKDGCRIVISSDDIRPFSWMNSIVLPEDMAQSESLWNSAAVRHEQSHVSHHHSIELLAIDILSAFQWFNPAVWLLRHDLCCVQEFQADASVLESGYGKLEYEQSLLSIATGGISIPLVNGLGESYLRARIRMMNRNISRKGNLIKLIYLPLVMVVALVLISNTVYDKAETDNTEVESDQEEAVTIFRFGEEVNKTFLEHLDEFDDTLKLKEVFRTDVGDKAKGFKVTLFNFTDEGWENDPGDFCLITIETGGKQYRFKNEDWVIEPLFDNGYFHCVEVAESHYLLFLKGFDYGCCPGTLTVLAVDETGAYMVMKKEYDLREFNSEPFSMTVADWYDEYVSDDVTINSATYTLFIEDGALKKRWVQLFPNKHEYVDLGLSVNWATCNVGAEKPEEYGDYYAWGETAPYYVKNAGADNELQWRKGKEAGYDWESYFDIKTIEPTDYDDIVTFWHYNTQEKSVIEYYHDAATINWGGEWRMPRQAEFEELINPDNCTWTWTTMNGVNGYRVTSKKPGYEGNSIFLPAAGGYSGTDSKLRDAYGWYWSGSIDDKTSDKSTNFAYILNFYFDTRFVFINSSGRCSGLPVRPVLPNGRNHKTVYGTNNEPIADNTEIEPKTAQTLLARFDGSLLESQVAIPSYQDYRELPQNLPDIILDSLKKQYPELNSLESIYDDGILSNDKPYKGYISCIQLSKGVYSFWVMGLEDKGGQVVSIELGTIDDAIAFLNNLVSSYKQGNTVLAQGYTLTGVRGNAYSVPRTDGVEPGPYLVSVKNLKHDLSVLEKRKNWKEVGFDEIAFFSMENKPDHYEVLFPGWPRLFESLHINTWDGVDGGEEWARTELEKQIRERGGEGHVPGNSELAVSKFNGVILLPLHKSDYMTLSGAYKEYIQYYIPIIYDPEKYQAPLTDYQRSLKRNVFRRKK